MAFAAVSFLSEVHFLGAANLQTEKCNAQHNAEQVESLRRDATSLIKQIASLTAHQLNALSLHIAQSHHNNLLERLHAAVIAYTTYTIHCSKPTSAIKYRLWRGWYDNEYRRLHDQLSKVASALSAATEHCSQQCAAVLASPSAVFIPHILPTELVSVGRRLGARKLRRRCRHVVAP